jgi:hypothetical protein
VSGSVVAKSASVPAVVADVHDRRRQSPEAPRESTRHTPIVMIRRGRAIARAAPSRDRTERPTCPHANATDQRHCQAPP